MPRERGLRWSYLWRVARRDLLGILRDRRTLTASILIPLVVLPLFTLGLPLLLGRVMGGQASARQVVGVQGTLPATLRAALSADQPGQTGLELRPVGDALASVQTGGLEAALRVVRPVPEQAGGAPVPLEVYAKLSTSRQGALDKVQAAVAQYNSQLAAQALNAAGLQVQVLTPVNLTTRDASSAAEKTSGLFAFILPMLLVQFILQGATASALDGTAGEKERGTLESLLVTPVRRSEVVAGKLTATTLTALATALFSFLGFILAGLLGSRLRGQDLGGRAAALLGGGFELNPGSVLAVLASALSAALLISALLTLLGIYARSFKEAQTYVAPLSLLIVLPAVLLQFADFVTRGAGLYSVPLINVLLVVLDATKGQLRPEMLLLALGVNLLVTVVLGALAWRSFGREEVIFRN